jgi:hypothetical protein
MIRTTHLALAIAAALTASGAALAQSQTTTSPPAAAAQPAPPPQPPPPWVQSDPAAIKPADRDANQPTYAVDPPPEGTSGVYLPSAVLGYAKSAAGCVVVGCADGPQGSGAAGPATSGPPPAVPATPAPAKPGSPTQP